MAIDRDKDRVIDPSQAGRDGVADVVQEQQSAGEFSLTWGRSVICSIQAFS